MSGAWATLTAAIDDVAATASRLLESIGVEVETGPDRWTPGSGQGRAAAVAIVAD